MCTVCFCSLVLCPGQLIFSSRNGVQRDLRMLVELIPLDQVHLLVKISILGDNVHR